MKGWWNRKCRKGPRAEGKDRHRMGALGTPSTLGHLFTFPPALAPSTWGPCRPQGLCSGCSAWPASPVDLPLDPSLREARPLP